MEIFKTSESACQGLCTRPSQQTARPVQDHAQPGQKKEIPGSQSNPANGVVLFNPNNAKERYLTAAETQRLYEALEQSDNTQLKHIVSLLLMFGCRKRELLDAKWEHFDLERRNWRIPMSKNGKARNIPIFASNLMNSGQSIYVVSKLLGHSQIKTTTRYSHLADETLLSAVDAAARVVDASWQAPAAVQA